MHNSFQRSVQRLLLPVLAVLAVACSPSTPKFKSTDISDVNWGGDFTLTAHTGQRVNVADFQGKLVILFFGYTYCPDVCAPTLARLAQLMKHLGDDAGRTQVLFITVDPRHDTVTQLAKFIPQFNSSFIGLTGTDKEIAAVAGEYKVAYGQNPKNQALVDHSTSIFIKDTKGKLRLLAKNDFILDDLARDVRWLLQEKN